MPQSTPDIVAMRALIAILMLAGAGSAPAAAAEPVPLPRPRPPAPPVWAEPHSFREAAGPDFNSAAVTDKPTDCDLRLAKVAAVAPMPRLIGPGACGGRDMIRVDAVLLADNKRVEITPAPYLRCAMAEQLVSWVRDDAAPRVEAQGAVLRTVDTYDDFECRGRNRVNGAKLSEHGKGDAVDVRGLTLADGHFIALTDTTVAKDLREALRKSACQRFTTVLGPGSDGNHEAHIHLDLIQRRNGYRICEWDVRVPPPSAGAAVPLPAPRPAVPDASASGRKL